MTRSLVGEAHRKGFQSCWWLKLLPPGGKGSSGWALQAVAKNPPFRGTWGARGDVCVVPSTLLVTGAVVPLQQHLWVWSLLAKQGLAEQSEAV